MLLVCGEALMDVYTTAQTPTGLTLDARIGGSPYNVALGLARLAQPVAFFGGVSAGMLGERLMQSMRDEGVATDWVARPDSPTTLSLVGLGADGKPVYEFMGLGGADRAVGQADLATLPNDWQAIHIGSYCTVVEPIASTLKALINRSQGRCPISFDVNVRTGVEPDLDVWRASFGQLSRQATIIKLSDEDLALLHPEQSVEQFAAHCLRGGAGLVLLTSGAAGATAWTRHGRVEVAAPSIQVIDTVGAGDTFQAAILAWLAERDFLTNATINELSASQLKKMLNFAVTAAALTCQRRGADLPRRGELPADSEPRQLPIESALSRHWR
jgi:fructokinase